MCGPTRANVPSTHSATSSNVRGMPSSLGFEHQRETYFHGIGHPLRTLPVALPRAEIQALELGGALELRARGGWGELEFYRHVLGHAAQCKRADGRISGRALGDAAREVVRGGPMRHIEHVGSADGL